jgi:hypothetical protein
MSCPNKAAYRYTWPGKDEEFICAPHARGISNLADIMSCHVQMIPLDDNVDEFCHQKGDKAMAEGDEVTVKRDLR